MKKKIKIIELINKVSRNEKPNKIKIDNEKLHWNNAAFNYEYESGAYLNWNYYIEGGMFDYEVEILDKEDEFEDIDDEFESGDTAQVICQLLNKIRPLIRNQKKIIERLKEEGK